ncbi:MAG: response regulator [Defluviitaleaceae bacterium]|nr:response regulator [Defluviitaleaceae bacterium]
MVSRILIIEDVRIMRILFRDILTRELRISDDNVYEAENGRQGIMTYKRVQPQYVFCDIHMPDISGIEVVKQIVALEPDPAPNIIMLTSSRERRTVIECIRAGANDYVSKPPTTERLAKILNIELPFLNYKYADDPKKAVKSTKYADAREERNTNLDIVRAADEKINDEARAKETKVLLEEIETFKALDPESADDLDVREIDTDLEALKFLKEKYVAKKQLK